MHQKRFFRSALSLSAIGWRMTIHGSIAAPFSTGTTRPIKPRVANTASSHSARWIQRQITDRYVIKAQFANYRSRAAFKLIQLDDKHLFLRKNQCVLDLGCFPGGWSQVALERCKVGAHQNTSKVIGVDKIQFDELPNHTFLQGEVGTKELALALQKILANQKVDVVLSDLSPACTGIKQDDHLLSAELALKSAELAEEVLLLGGSFIVKIFMGGQTSNFKVYLQSRFENVKAVKPKASRKDSPEVYFVCQNFMGRTKISSEVQTKGGFTTKEGFQ